MNKEVFISYAWDDSGKNGRLHDPILDAVAKTLEDNGYTVKIDKKDVGYKDNIQEFEERLGRGDRIVLIINDKFLKSYHCMYELLQISDNGNVYERIFPIVCKDAKIHKATDHVPYINHWVQRTNELETIHKSMESTVNAFGIRSEIDNSAKIRWMVPTVLDLLGKMNTLSPEEHEETNFSSLINLMNGKRAIGLNSNEEKLFRKRMQEIKVLYERAMDIIEKEFKLNDIKDGEILKKLQEWYSQCVRQSFLIGVMAMIKSGKSTFLNALLGKEYLPMSNVTETAVSVRIVHYDGEEAYLLNHNGEKIVGVKNINEYLRKRNQERRDNKSKDIYEYKLFASIGALDGQESSNVRLEVMDTPGFGELLPEVIVGKSIEESNADLIEKLSTIIYLLDYTKLKTQSEKDILDKLATLRPDLLNKIQERLFFIVNKIDEKDRDSLPQNETTDYIFNLLHKTLPKLKKDQIYHLSARKALLARLIQTGGATAQAKEDFGNIAFGIMAPKMKNDMYISAANEVMESSKILEIEERLINFLYAQRGKILISSLLDNLKRILLDFNNKHVITAVGTLNAALDDIVELEKKIDDTKKKQKNIQEEAEKFEIQIKGWIEGRFLEFEKDILDNIESAFNYEKAEVKRKWLKKIIKEWVAILQRKVSAFENESQSHSKEAVMESVSNLNYDISEQLRPQFDEFRQELEYKLYSKQDQLLGSLESAINTLAREFETTLGKALHVNLEPIELELESAIDFDKVIIELNSIMDRFVEKEHQPQRVRKSYKVYNEKKWCGFGGHDTYFYFENVYKENYSISKESIELYWKQTIEAMNANAKKITNHFIESQIQRQIVRATKSFDDYVADYLFTIQSEKAKLSAGGINYMKERLIQLADLQNEISNIVKSVESLEPDSPAALPQQ